MKLRISKLEQLQYPSVLRRLVTVVTPFAMLSPSIAGHDVAGSPVMGQDGFNGPVFS
jgi:hypothetical protein